MGGCLEVSWGGWVHGGVVVVGGCWLGLWVVVWVGGGGVDV